MEAIILKFVFFFDFLPGQSNIMVDKGFNLFDECKARCVNFTVPSGKIRASQRIPTKIIKLTLLSKDVF